jgi:hypothetical protein
MENKTLEELQGNEKNPRRISKQDFESLKKSIQEFGDLSGIVFNIQTKQLVGGHQRVQAFKHLKGASVHIIERLETANAKGTVAVGYVTMGDERYAYREVDWDANRELAANIAANRISGEWDLDLLAEANYELFENDKDLLALTGQSDDEISKLLNNVSATDQDDKGDQLNKRNVLEIDCASDEEMQTVYQELTDRGLKCRILTL